MSNQSGAKDIAALSAAAAEIEAQLELPEAERADKLRLLDISIRNKISPILQGMLNEGERTELTTYSEWMDYLIALLKKLGTLTAERITKITAHEVAAIVAASTGIPLGKIESGEKDKLLKMEELLRRRGMGQDKASKWIG